MSPIALVFLVSALGLAGWLAARVRAAQFRSASTARFSSLPGHHGWFVALWTLLPPLVFLFAWNFIGPALVTDAVIATPAAAALPPPGFERASILSEARDLAAGRAYGAFHPLASVLAPAYDTAQSRYDWIATALALLLAFAAGAFAFIRVRPGFSARTQVERVVMGLLLGASLVAILTTIGIVASLLFESARFFRIVPIGEFLFGTHWSPQVIDARDPGASLGAVPLFWGTFFIGAVIAMIVAIPFGLMSAIYLTQYAKPAVRQLGVSLGIANASSESALAAGAVMGVMIIPFVSSMADDSLAAVPSSMRDGSLAMGATPSETIRRVLVPAALPGIVGGVLLAISRAIGETMIVVMAASGVATLTANPFASTTTVTKQIVDLLTGEAEFDSAKTLAAFALGLTLFVVTLLLNIVALIVVKRYREAYD